MLKLISVTLPHIPDCNVFEQKLLVKFISIFSIGHVIRLRTRIETTVIQCLFNVNSTGIKPTHAHV